MTVIKEPCTHASNAAKPQNEITAFGNVNIVL
jgi:hypothetical protein